jgi:hypothetical protein
VLALRKIAANPQPEVSVADRLFATFYYVPLQIERKVTNRGKRTWLGRRKTMSG